MMATGGTTTEQKLALTFEIETAVKLLRLGLAELQNIDGGNDFYHLPFLLLSSGFERLMKCMICLKWRHDTGVFPPTAELKTHDLVKLKARVLSECVFEDTASKRPATKEDYGYMEADEDLRRLLEMLSQFGKFARYYNLDVVTGSAKRTVNAQEMWEQYEGDLVKKHGALSSLSGELNRIDDFYRELNRIIVGKLERFARALVRQFTLGDLGADAKKHTGIISAFLYLSDNELGKRNYAVSRNS